MGNSSEIGVGLGCVAMTTMVVKKMRLFCSQIREILC